MVLLYYPEAATIVPAIIFDSLGGAIYSIYQGNGAFCVASIDAQDAIPFVVPAVLNYATIRSTGCGPIVFTEYVRDGYVTVVKHVFNRTMPLSITN